MPRNESLTEEKQENLMTLSPSSWSETWDAFLAFLKKMTQQTAEISLGFNKSKAGCSTVSVVQHYHIRIVWAASHTPTGHSQGGINTLKQNRAEDQAAVIARRASEIHSSVDKEWKIALTFTAHIPSSGGDKQPEPSHTTALRFFVIIKLSLLIWKIKAEIPH